MVPSCSVNPCGSSKDKNEDEQEHFTGSQDFVITCRILQSRVLFTILPVCFSKLLDLKLIRQTHQNFLPPKFSTIR